MASKSTLGKCTICNLLGNIIYPLGVGVSNNELKRNWNTQMHIIAHPQVFRGTASAPFVPANGLDTPMRERWICD